MTMLVAMLLLVSCGKKQGENLIPEDALFVIRIDAAQLTDKAGLKDGESQLLKKLKKQLKDSGLDKEMRDRVSDILEDPTKSGLDFTEPMFIYVAGDFNKNVDGGLVGAVANKDDLADLINAIAEMDGKDEVEESDGVSYMVSDDAGIFFTKDWFYIGPSKDADETIETLLDRADGNGNIVDNEAFKKMCSKKGVMQTLILGSGMDNLPNIDELTKAMPKGTELKDIAGIIDLVLNEGETIIESETVAMSDEWNEYVEKYENSAKEIDSKQLKYISDECFSAFLNVDIKETKKYFLDVLKEAGVTSSEMIDMIGSVIDEMTGTAEFCFTGVSEDGKPQMTVYVGTESDAALNMILSDLGDSLAMNDEGQYLIPITDYDWYNDRYVTTGYNVAGYDNGRSYFSTNPDNVFKSPSKKVPADDVKGKGIYLRFNFDYLNTLSEQMGGGEEAKIAEMVAKNFGIAELYYDGEGRSVLRVTNKGKKNLIEVISDMIKDFI